MTAGPFTTTLLQEILPVFDKRTVERGRAYARQGLATVEENSDGEIFGHCRNSTGHTYRCEVYLHHRTVDATCSCPVGGFCKHCVALLITAAADPPLSTTNRSLNNWRTLLTELNSVPEAPLPRADEPVRPVGLMFTVTEAFQRQRYLKVRPVTTGKAGRWVVSRLTWQHLTFGQPEDPHDIGDLDLLRRFASSLRAGSDHGAFADEISLIHATAETWNVLREIVDAGIALVAGTNRHQPPKVQFSDEISTALHVRAAQDGVDVTVDVLLDGAPVPLRNVLRLGGKSTTGLGLIFDGVLTVGPIAPLSPTETRLLESGATISVPAAELDEFTEALPTLTAARSVQIDDGAIVPQVVTGPILVLQIDVADDHTSSLFWLIEYIVDDEPRQFTIFDDPAATAFRDPAAEEELEKHAFIDMVAVAVAAFPVWQEYAVEALYQTYENMPPRQQDRTLIHTAQRLAEETDPTDAVLNAPSTLRWLALNLEPLETATLIDLGLPSIRAHGNVEVRVNGGPDYRAATLPPTLTFSGDVDADPDWFDLMIAVDVDGNQVPIAELLRLLTAGETHMVLPDGTYFALDIPELDDLRVLLDEAREMGEIVGDRVSTRTLNPTLWEELLQLGVVDDQLEEWEQRISRLSQARPPRAVAPPAALQAELRPYQQDGLNWLMFLWDNELGGILADDMGLGKTVQTLALIAKVHETRPDARFLVVAPTSVVGNWAAEARKFLPDLPVATVSATAKRLKKPLPEIIGDARIVVTSYALLRIDYDAYAEIDWAGAIFDEGQFLKNHNSQAHQAARKLPAPFKLAITGTPMENRIMELWSLVSITAPGLYSSPKKFKEHFAGPIERGHAPERLQVLRRRLKPIMLRRTKDQVLTDLPPKQEQILELALEPAHRKIYDTFLTHERQQLLGLLEDWENNRIQVLRALTRLRQLSLHPGLVDDEHSAVKSAKIAYLSDQLPVLIDEGHSALIFSSFTGFLQRLSTRLDEQGIAYSYLDGSMNAKQRTAQIEAFTNGETQVFLISLKAGGFGLNLTTADYCFMADPWWNPAAESQAVDRAHRIGQQRPVTVYRMVSQGTIEEKVIDLQNRKRELFAALIDDDAQFSGAITADDVRSLLAE